MSAFDMAREMQITPKRLEYARMKESELFENLMKIAEKKQGEMCSLIAETISERREDILLKAQLHTFRGKEIHSDFIYDVGSLLGFLCLFLFDMIMIM